MQYPHTIISVTLTSSANTIRGFGHFRLLALIGHARHIVVVLQIPELLFTCRELKLSFTEVALGAAALGAVVLVTVLTLSVSTGFFTDSVGVDRVGVWFKLTAGLTLILGAVVLAVLVVLRVARGSGKRGADSELSVKKSKPKTMVVNRVTVSYCLDRSYEY